MLSVQLSRVFNAVALAIDGTDYARPSLASRVPRFSVVGTVDVIARRKIRSVNSQEKFFPGRNQQGLALAADLRRFLRREPIEARAAGLGTRLGNWCRRPQRIRDAALTGYIGAVLGGSSCMVGLFLLLCGVLPSERPLAGGVAFLAGIANTGLMAWTARQTARRNFFALWLGVFVPFIWPAYVVSAANNWIDTGGILEAQDVSLVLSQMATILLLSVIQWICYITALIAYYANRRRPGFAAPRF